MSDNLPEAERRKQVTDRGRTDVERWSNTEQLDPAWTFRSQMTAEYIPSGATVLDLGCGRMTLEQSLPRGCTYVPCDVVARDARTIVCDFNHGEFPTIQNFTHITVLGVLEYLFDVPTFLGKLRATECPVLLSYCPDEMTRHLDRGALGWVNHLDLPSLRKHLNDAGFSIASMLQVDAVQVLMRLLPRPMPAAPPKQNVLVLSALNVDNFGDRLGYHLINEALPAHATIRHATFDFKKGCKLMNVPQEKIDLLILGIGNSLFRPMLTDELLGLVKSVPHTIGIFGTQYREHIDRAKMDVILDHLTMWYARSEEDMLLFGGGRPNVTHLGDWLISAFPMSKGTRSGIGRIGHLPQVPLDRMIQSIQYSQRVEASRLHMMLCALTSAEQLSYKEQREVGGGVVSGKFRSLLFDIFGRTYPENQFFVVDRDAVIAYKMKVQAAMEGLRRTLRETLAKA